MRDDVSKIQEEERKARAFKAFQDAARNKDKDPETFEAARMRYYFLSKGPGWLEQEKNRIASEKIDPVLDQYRDIFTSLSNEEQTQRAYTDSIQGIRDKQSTLKAEAGKQTSYFKRLADEENRKKSAFDRIVELTSPAYEAKVEATQEAPFVVKYFAGFPSSFNIILDVILGLFIVIILFLGISKVRRGGMFRMFTPFTQPQGSINIFQSPAPSTFGRSP